MTEKYPPGAPNWIDLGTADVAAATTFYGRVFGWTVAELGPEAGGYGMIHQGGKEVAGIGPATDPARGSSWAVYFATADADASAARVEAHGGKVVVPPMDVMEQGRFAVFTDPAGAYFSVWQPGTHLGAEITDVHGSMTWIELMTPDIESAKEFYPAVLGADSRDVEVGEGMTYTLLSIGGKDVAGAMAAGPAVPPRWSVYFAVDDTDLAADTAISLGATEMLREDAPPGRMAILSDPQGAVFGIIKNNPDYSM